MAIINVIWFRSKNFKILLFENTNAFGFFDMWVQIVPLFYSRGEKNIFQKCHVLPEFREDLVFGEGISWKRYFGD